MHPQPTTEDPPVSGSRLSNGEAHASEPQPLSPSEPRRLSPSDFPAGQIVAGKYRVERWIGEGAMGVVLAATHLGLDETVAIKLIRPDVRSPEMLARFAKEAKIAARIRSEHVVRVLDVGVSDRFGPYIVMEYLEGRSLAEVLESEGKLDARRAAEYVLQACEALAAAHAIGVIHRDIKPANLFITQHGSLEMVKLLDFGISKAALRGRVFGNDLALNETTHVMGTPMYMSPEQIRSAPEIDSRTDIWSLGAVIYELVTGQTAFIAESMTEICAQILEGPVPQLDAGLGPQGKALQEIVKRCLSREPSERFQTVADLATALLPLASDSARLYADRSSCILRASGLGLTRASSPIAVGGGPLAPAAVEEPRRARRRAAWVAGGLAVAGIVGLLYSATLPGAPRAQSLAPSAPNVLPSSLDSSPREPSRGVELPAAQASRQSAIVPPEGAEAHEGLASSSEPPAEPSGSEPREAASAAAASSPAKPERVSASRPRARVADKNPAGATASEETGEEASSTRMRLVRGGSRMRLVGLSETAP